MCYLSLSLPPSSLSISLFLCLLFFSQKAYLHSGSEEQETQEQIRLLKKLRNKVASKQLPQPLSTASLTPSASEDTPDTQNEPTPAPDTADPHSITLSAFAPANSWNTERKHLAQIAQERQAMLRAEAEKRKELRKQKKGFDASGKKIKGVKALTAPTRSTFGRKLVKPTQVSEFL